MSRNRPVPRMAVLLSALVALTLAIVPLPGVIDRLRPDFLVLVVYYWSIEAPSAGGLALAFAAGLAIDVVRGVVLGEHALALTLTAAWAIHLRLRIRVFSIPKQALTIFGLLAIYQFILFWVDGATGYPVTDWSRWLGPFIGAAVWPLVVATLRRLHER